MASEYKIVSAWNNSASLVAIDSITPSGDIRFHPPTAFSTYRLGTRFVNADGSVTNEGYARVTWFFSFLTEAQYQYLYDLQTHATNANKVTIRTYNEEGVAGNYNARLLLLPRADLPSPRIANTGKKTYGVSGSPVNVDFLVIGVAS